MNFKDLPGRIFLDTNVVNLMLDFGEQIHENVALPTGISSREAADVVALRHLYETGKRAEWQLAVSPQTYAEILGTRESARQASLDLWFHELWQYWRTIVASDSDAMTFVEFDDLRVRTWSSGYLSILPDVADRVLVCDAIAYRCDLFCTRDWSTILRHRNELSALPFRIVTPAEWWAVIEPFAPIWA